MYKDPKIRLLILIIKYQMNTAIVKKKGEVDILGLLLMYSSLNSYIRPSIERYTIACRIRGLKDIIIYMSFYTDNMFIVTSILERSLL